MRVIPVPFGGFLSQKKCDRIFLSNISLSVVLELVPLRGKDEFEQRSQNEIILPFRGPIQGVSPEFQPR